MKTIILAVAIRWLIPVFIIFSLYILFRGHNHPGGGFIGGLICSIAFIFHLMVHGPQKTTSDFFTLILYHFPRRPEHSRTRHFLRLLIIQVKRKREADEEYEWLEYVISIEPVYFIATGLLLAAISGVAGLLLNQPYMAALWSDFEIPVLGKPGTPILFDAGVYLLVLGIVLKITIALAEAD
ncbi:MnhB domain-containing protein [Adhaeribacter terreus]|uniref:MnhB domain-containing protein n=1 Tax=Adhaeribacter terreus TaxID=529703 RepID=A0ABW0EGV5_9BACT